MLDPRAISLQGHRAINSTRPQLLPPYRHSHDNSYFSSPLDMGSFVYKAEYLLRFSKSGALTLTWLEPTNNYLICINHDTRSIYGRWVAGHAQFETRPLSLQKNGWHHRHYLILGCLWLQAICFVKILFYAVIWDQVFTGIYQVFQYELFTRGGMVSSIPIKY